MAEFIEVLSQKSKEDIDKLIKQLGLVAAEVNTINKAFKDVKLPSTASKQINETRKATKGLNAEQKEAKRLSQTLAREKAKLTKASGIQAQAIQRLRFENTEANKRTKEAAVLGSRMATMYQKVQIELTQLIRTQQDLMLKQQLGIKLTKQEEATLRNTTASINRKDEALKRTDESAGKFQRSVGNYGKALGGAMGAVQAMTSALGFMGGAFLAVSVLRSAFNTLKEFDKQLIAVRKTTNLSTTDIKLFSDEVVALGIDLKGISIQGLLASSEIAGQLGIKGRDNILTFAKTIEQLKLTSNIAGEESARAFAKFIEISKDTVENADRLGSVITELGNNFATTESEILKNSLEIQRAANIYAVTAQAALGLGAATSALGIQAEASRSAFLQTFKVLNEGIATGEKLDLILRLTGQSASEFKQEFDTDAVATFQKFIKGLKDASDSGENLTLILQELKLDGLGVMPVIGTLASKYDVLEGALSKANKEYIDNNALSREAGVSADSLDSIIGDLKDSFDGLVLSLDSGSGPFARFIKTYLEGTTKLLNFIGEFALTQEQIEKRNINEVLSIQRNEYKRLGDAAEKTAQQNKMLFESLLPDILEEIAKQNEIVNGTWTNSGIAIGNAEDKLVKLNKQYREHKAVLQGANEFLEKTRILNEGVDGSVQNIIFKLKEQQRQTLNGSEAWKELGRQVEAAEIELAKINGTFNGVDAAIGATIPFFDKIISKLEAQQLETSTTRKEWVKYQEQIDKAKESLRLLTRELLGMEDQTTVNQIETRGITDIESDDSFASTNIGLEKFNQLTKEGQENTEKLMDLLDKLSAKDIIFDELQGLGDLLNIDTNILEDSFDIITDKSAEMSDKIIAGAEAVGTILTGIGRTLAQDEIIRINNEIAENDRLYNARIQQAEGDAEQQDLLRQEQERKRVELEQKKAEQQRKAALFEIAVSTAVAIAKTFATLGFPAGILPALAVAAIGAAQVAIVASRPLPQYKKGRKGGEDEYAILGDGYKEEAIVGKDGNLKGISPNKPTMMHLDKGDSVIPSLNNSIARSAVLDSITMNANKMSPASDTQNQINAMRNENSRLKKDIIGSLRNANFVNNNRTSVDMGHQFKLLKYKGK
jgi:TP901 family phage tail tape measure protein